MHHLFIVVSDGGKPAPLHTTVWVNLMVNESMEPCQLDRVPTWTGPPDFLVQTPSKAPVCEVEGRATRSAQLTLLVGLGMMLASICLLVATAVLYVLAMLWLLVFALSALPVYFFYNMDATCHTIDVLTETPASINQLCVDARQYGLLPWNAVPGKACGITLSTICKTREYRMTYDLYIAAFFGAGITLLALLTYTVSTTYNFATLRYLGRKGIGARC